ncbi:hypothetical protein CEXT_451201 [Caerostris extrusa]|uniref:Uncharacterized protein n=1 Tax=Caerostris extrusa TaxID=172846 RepID=A0AAV4Y362_CAEEX|nr:hypothetical protein CEXT_451201 [Caerostris extrusa]
MQLQGRKRKFFHRIIEKELWPWKSESNISYSLIKFRVPQHDKEVTCPALYTSITRGLRGLRVEPAFMTEFSAHKELKNKEVEEELESEIVELLHCSIHFLK